MNKEQRPVSLVVQQHGNCPLVKEGEGFSVRGCDLTNPRGGKLCANAICSIYPKLGGMLKTLSTGSLLPRDVLRCEEPGCGATFRLEEPTPRDQSGIFTTPFMRRKSDKAFLSEGDPKTKPIPFMKRLTLDLSDELHFVGVEKKFSDGQVILHQGVIVNHFFLITHGMAGVVVKREGEETLIGSIGEGDFFGEYSLLTGTVCEHEVRAVGDCAALAINQKEFYQLLLKRPALLHVVSKYISEKLKAAAASVENELSRGILGKLSMIPLVDLVQTLSQSRRTGTLVIHYRTEQAFMLFLNGALISAVAGKNLGEEAFYRVLGWQDGEFCFEPSEPFESKSDRNGAITIDTIHLIMEGLRRVDEMRAQQQQ